MVCIEFKSAMYPAVNNEDEGVPATEHRDPRITVDMTTVAGFYTDSYYQQDKIVEGVYVTYANGKDSDFILCKYNRFKEIFEQVNGLTIRTAEEFLNSSI